MTSLIIDLDQTVALASHRFTAQAFRTRVQPAPRIPRMLTSCCYLHVRHVFVCVHVCVQEKISLCVRFREKTFGHKHKCADNLSGKGPPVCVPRTGCRCVSPGSPGCVRSLGSHPLSCTSPPPLPSSCIHLRGGEIRVAVKARDRRDNTKETSVPSSCSSPSAWLNENDFSQGGFTLRSLR